MGDDRESDCRAQALGAHAKSVGIGVEVLPDGGSWPADGCLHRSQCQLVRANCPCQWVFREALNERRIAEEESGLRSAQKFVAAGDDEVGTGFECRGGVGFVGTARAFLCCGRRSGLARGGDSDVYA